MYFGIYPEYLVDDIILSGKKAILIRIHDKDWYYKLKTEYLYSNVLDLCISDMPLEMVNDEFRESLKEALIKLNEFVLNNDFDEIVVHCGAGVSRSPAIMICIAKILGNRQIEQIVRDNFVMYNKAIVNEFNNYNFKVKDMKIEEVVYKGLCFSKNEDINFGDLFFQNNKKCYLLKKK